MPKGHTNQGLDVKGKSSRYEGKGNALFISNIFSFEILDKSILMSVCIPAVLSIPKDLLTDENLKNFIQYDYKKNKDICKYYFRLRRLRGYISFSLKFHNLESFKIYYF